MPSTENIRLGTCKVFYDSVDLGFTIGGVEVEVVTSTHETKVDQFGESVANEHITGRTIKVTAPLAETTLDQMVKVMPGSELITTGVAPTIKKKVNVKTGIGLSLFDLAKELVLHPIGKADTDKSEDLVIPKAGIPGAMNFAFKHDAERVFNCEFKGYPDPTTGVLFIYGDKSA